MMTAMIMATLLEKKRVLKESTAVAASKFWFLETRAPLFEELLDFFEALDLDEAG